MDVYLAAAITCNLQVMRNRTDYKELFLLDSYAYASDALRYYVPKVGKFLLDSGAFTFVGSAKDKNIDWVSYVDQYADFIKSNDIRLFFELDIDALIGYERVIRLRRRLETRAERRCIPVWHKTRGKQDFIDMCKEYPYVSVGGLVGAGGQEQERICHHCRDSFRGSLTLPMKTGQKFMHLVLRALKA